MPDLTRDDVLAALEHVIDTSGVAELAGIKPASVMRYRVRDDSFPEPLLRLGRGTTPVWFRPDVEAWKAARPGRGAGGGRPKKGDHRGRVEDAHGLFRFSCSCGEVGRWLKTSPGAQGGLDRHLEKVAA